MIAGSMNRIIVAVVFLALSANTTLAQLISHKNIVPDSYNFWICLPEGKSPDDSTKIPAVLFLHGKSLCGSDLNRVRRYGSLDAVAKGLDIDAVIIAPQNGGGAWRPEKLMNILKWSEEHYPIDTNRVYVIGMSLGGFGTIRFAGTYPDKVAAAMALCGGGDLKDYSGLRRVPLWIIHGTADRAVSWHMSQKVVDELSALGDTSRLNYTLLKGVDHSKLARYFYRRHTYDWLFSHSLTDSLRLVTRDSLTLESLENVYKDLSPRKLKVFSYSVVSGEGVISDTMENTLDDPVYHTIRQGDTLSGIAKRYHTTVSSLCSLNGIRKETILKIGHRLRIR